MSEHWSKIASIWKQVGAPLRPSAQDTQFLENEIHLWSKANGEPSALILGVTPELYNLNWPDGTELKAVDHTQHMIDALWPGKKSDVICAEWVDIPVEDCSRDIVLCDGGIHLMQYPDDHQVFVKTMQRILAPGGLCVFRLFTPPKEHEVAMDVLSDLLNSNIPNLNILKLRLGMSLQREADEGVELKNIWNTINQAAPEFEKLADRIGWPLQHLLAINTYRNSTNKYYFMSLDDVLELFCEDPGGFELVKTYKPTYELGERCPTVVLRKL